MERAVSKTNFGPGICLRVKFHHDEVDFPYEILALIRSAEEPPNDFLPVAFSQEGFFDFLDELRQLYNINPNKVLFCADANFGNPGGDSITLAFKNLMQRIHPTFLVAFSSTTACVEAAESYLDVGSSFRPAGLVDGIAVNRQGVPLAAKALLLKHFPPPRDWSRFWATDAPVAAEEVRKSHWKPPNLVLGDASSGGAVCASAQPQLPSSEETTARGSVSPGTNLTASTTQSMAGIQFVLP